MGAFGRFARILPLVFVVSCNRHQSAFATFGEEARNVATLTLVLVVGAALIGLGMAALMWAAVRAPEGRMTLASGERLILWVGGIGPAVLLLALLAWSLPLMRPLAARPVDLRIAIEGEQFWWRVRYQPAGGGSVTSANEVRLPVGRTVVLRLTGADVVHSFWVPGLAGKTDMIPGRETLMAVRATRPGTFRGQCTEFCGLSHALMAFDVVAMEPQAFDAWLDKERRPAAAVVGKALFDRYGCGACHTIRGSGTASDIGPDLTHFGSRRTLAAGVLVPTEANVAAFIRHSERTKPGVRMPAFDDMPVADALAIARYLKGLR